MNKVEQIQYLSNFIERLDQEPSYEARKVRTLLDSWQEMLVAEMMMDAVLADLASGNLACEV